MRVQTEIIPVPIRKGTAPLMCARAYVETLASRTVHVLRWGIIEIKEQIILLEVTTLVDYEAFAPAPALKLSRQSTGPVGLHVALIIPTGVGAAIGGFIGDAGPLVRVIEALADTVVVHPNVVNGADFSGIGERSYFVEGYTLDKFLSGAVRLKRCNAPRIGLLLDNLGHETIKNLLTATDGICAVRGCPVAGYSICTDKVRATVQQSGFGHYIGAIENPDVLFDPLERLIAKGANCIAVVTDIAGVSVVNWVDHYVRGKPNPIGSLEALVSRTVTFVSGVPCAHAPASLPLLDERELIIDPRVAAEITSGTGLPCLLEGFRQLAVEAESGGLAVMDLSAIIIPASCAGGVPSLSASEFGVPLVAVKENSCQIGVSISDLNMSSVTEVANYAEAVGFLACCKARVAFQSISRPFNRVPEC